MFIEEKLLTKELFIHVIFRSSTPGEHEVSGASPKEIPASTSSPKSSLAEVRNTLHIFTHNLHFNSNLRGATR